MKCLCWCRQQNPTLKLSLKCLVPLTFESVHSGCTWWSPCCFEAVIMTGDGVLMVTGGDGLNSDGRW